MLGAFSSVWEKKGTDMCKDILRHEKGGCVKIDTSSYLLPLYLVYHIIRYLLQLRC